MNKVLKTINGKKKVIITGAGAGGLLISMPFLISFLLNLNTTIAETKTQVNTNTKQIEQLDKLPIQMAAVETNVENIKEDIGKIEQVQAVIGDDIKKILQRLPR